MRTATESYTKRVGSIVSVLAQEHAIGSSFGIMDSLVDGGFTSVAMVELMLATEREFDFTIPDKELNPANFSCICSLASLVVRMCPEGEGIGSGTMPPLSVEINSPSKQLGYLSES